MFLRLNDSTLESVQGLIVWILKLDYVVSLKKGGCSCACYCSFFPFSGSIKRNCEERRKKPNELFARQNTVYVFPERFEISWSRSHGRHCVIYLTHYNDESDDLLKFSFSLFTAFLMPREIMRSFIGPLTALIMINILHDVLLHFLRFHLRIFGDCKVPFEDSEATLRQDTKLSENLGHSFLLTQSSKILTEKKFADTSDFTFPFSTLAITKLISDKMCSRISQWLFRICSVDLKKKNELTLHFFGDFLPKKL